MIKPLELFIALRYTRAKRRNRFISFISIISILGIALGIWALIVITSVMNGFQKELRDRILGTTAHIKITGEDKRLMNWQAIQDKLKQYDSLRSAPYIHAEGMIINGEFTTGSVMRGIMPEQEAKVTDITSKIRGGSLTDLKPGKFNIILGADLAAALSVTVGEQVTVVSPRSNPTPAGLVPRLKRFNVVAVFNIGMYEYDSSLAMVHMQDAAKLFRYRKNQVSGLRVMTEDLFSAEAIAETISGDLGSDYKVSDWTKENVSFFQALKVEKIVMSVILTLVILVAVFNVVAILVMMATEKEGDIAILRTLGLEPKSVMYVFMIQGSLLGIIGTSLGIILGVGCALNIDVIVPGLESLTGHKLFPDDIYYISEVPSDLEWGDVIQIGVVAILLSILSTIYPARKASNIQPAEVLRYDW